MNWRQRFFNRLFRRTCKISRKLPAFMLLVSLLFLDLSPFLSVSVFIIQEVLADSGDFSIFRNASDNASIPAGGAKVQVSWDTDVIENANIDLLGGGIKIDLIE